MLMNLERKDYAVGAFARRGGTVRNMLESATAVGHHANGPPLNFGAFFPLCAPS